MRYLELFAGAGGLSLGLDAAGLVPVCHAEIEPHARAVLRRHWPDVPLLADVRAVRGAEWACELVSGGSPCQDLSVAGKRAGLSGARSGLFHEQVRVWEESGARYFLWENVLGALSSNSGADFAAVLSALVGGAVPVPTDGWGSAGVVAGPTGVAAFRVLDLQWFGPPQRRRRVFVLGARAGGVDPAEVLLECESVCGHPAPRRDAGEGAAGRAARGAAVTFYAQLGTHGGGVEEGGLTPTLKVENTVAVAPIPFDTTQITSAANYSRPRAGDTDHPLAAGAHPPAIAFDWQNSASMGMECRSASSDALRTTSVPAVLAFDQFNQAATEGVEHTLCSGNVSNGLPAVLTFGGEGVRDALTAGGHDASEDGTGRGTPIVLASGQANAEVSDSVCPTLSLLHEAPIAFTQDGDGIVRAASVTQTLTNVSSRTGTGAVNACTAGVPRRLLPVECERLMGWGDGHTEHGVREDGTRYRLSDSARYKLCGNGVGAPVAAWIGRRLRDAHEAMTAGRLRRAA